MAKSPYVQSLIQIVNDKMPELEYNINNTAASSLFANQKCLKEIHQILMYLLHHAIIEAGGLPEPQPQQVQAPVAPVAPVFQSQPVATRGSLAHLSPIPGMPAAGPEMPGPSAVTEVVVTQNGARVIPPGGQGPIRTVPPHQPVDATLPSAAAPEAPTIFVAKPELTPEARAALAAAGIQT